MTRRRDNTKKPKSGRNVELGKIHVAATQLHMIQPGDDSIYRDMLWSVARVRSAKDLDNTGRLRVLQHLKALGWVDPNPYVRRSAETGRPQVQKIRELWHALGAAGELHSPGDDGLRAFVRHQSAPYHPDKVGYDAPELLPAAVAQRVIEHLKQWCRRKGVEV